MIKIYNVRCLWLNRILILYLSKDIKILIVKNIGDCAWLPNQGIFGEMLNNCSFSHCTNQLNIKHNLIIHNWYSIHFGFNWVHNKQAFQLFSDEFRIFQQLTFEKLQKPTDGPLVIMFAYLLFFKTLKQKSYLIHIC